MGGVVARAAPLLPNYIEGSLRTLVTPYVKDWHEHRKREIEESCARGEVPFMVDARALQASETGDVRVGPNRVEFGIGSAMPLLMGQASGAIEEIQTAQEIMECV